MAETPVQTREQHIVATLQAMVPVDNLDRFRSRARSLPAMLRRHGPLQVLLFLHAKEGSDKKLAEWVESATAEALGLPELQPESLATLDLPNYLLRWEVALEVASWIKMLIEARTEVCNIPPTNGIEPSAEEPG